MLDISIIDSVREIIFLFYYLSQFLFSVIYGGDLDKFLKIHTTSQ